MIQGSKIIITRKDDQRDKIGQSLRDRGAEVINLELIQFSPLEISEQAWSNIISGEYQWLVFTSTNGIVNFFDQLKQRNHDLKLRSKIAVFGQRTAQTLRSYGLQPDIIGKNETAVILAKALKEELAKDDKVLLLLGNLASNELYNALSSICVVKRLDVYETSNLKSTQQLVFDSIAGDDYDLIIITSPSSYDSLKFNMQNNLRLDSSKVVCLGPTTRAALAGDGIVPIIEAKPSDSPDLYERIEEQLDKVKKINLQ